MVETLLNNQWYVLYLAIVMIVSAYVRKNNTFTPFFKWVSTKIKSKRAVVGIISLVSGVLPIPGRVTVSAGILNTIAPNDSRREKYGLVDYLSTHHYYFWSPLEKTVIVPMAVLSISYSTFLGLIWPLLLTSLIYMVYYIFYVVKEDDIELSFDNVQSQDVKWIDWKTLAILSIIIAAGNYLQVLDPYIVERLSNETLYMAMFFSFIAAFLLGSSSKFAGVVSILTSIFGLKYLPVFFALDYAGYMLSPFHKCLTISRGIFNTNMIKFYKTIGTFTFLILLSGIFSSAVNAEEKEQIVEEVVVVSAGLPQFDNVGEYNQPVWTLTRKFPSTRSYVMTPPGTVMYEKWFDVRERRNGVPQVRMRDELAFGLGGRWELDLYAHTVYDGLPEQRQFGWRGFSWEVRYALADWGKIWGNPTLYFEHKLMQGKMGIEPKLLLSDRFGKSSYIWSLNLIYEANIADEKEDQEREYAATYSVGKVISDNFTVGLTSMYRYNDFGEKTDELYVGPNFQYRFNQNAHISFEYMPNLRNEDGYKARSYLIFAWRF